MLIFSFSFYHFLKNNTDENPIIIDTLSDILTHLRKHFAYSTWSNLPKELVPEGAKEVDLLRIEIDNEETQNRKSWVQKLMDDVWA